MIQQEVHEGLICHMLQQMSSWSSRLTTTNSTLNEFFKVFSRRKKISKKSKCFFSSRIQKGLEQKTSTAATRTAYLQSILLTFKGSFVVETKKNEKFSRFFFFRGESRRVDSDSNGFNFVLRTRFEPTDTNSLSSRGDFRRSDSFDHRSNQFEFRFAQKKLRTIFVHRFVFLSFRFEIEFVLVVAQRRQKTNFRQ